MPASDDRKVRVAILISGAGSNMAALIDAAGQPEAPYQIALVISNRPDAGGLAVAAASGVPTLAIDHLPFAGDRQAHERAIHDALTAQDVQIVALAGYMRLLTPWLVGRWAGRMINIHPSLLPKYPGLDTHARALAAGDAEAGCTVHVVTDGVDEGPILGQASAPIVPGDSPESLAQRVLTLEHALYPRVLAGICRAL
jgi:phosphoribosylglycinamide formyltransferase 1